MQYTFIPPATFLNRLKWKTQTGEFDDMKTLSVDCFRFTFPEPLLHDVQYAFIEYMETLDLYKELSIVQMAVWLTKRGIRYRLSFSWRRSLPVSYNIRSLLRPRKLRRLLDRRMPTLIEMPFVP